MPYLIDGHNLIPKIPGMSLKSVDDEVELIKRLQKFCRHSGKTVEIYFDNAPAGQARAQRFGLVKAHFTRAGRTADEAIIARLRSLGRAAKNWSVVSSDRQIAATARELHAQIIPSDEFAGLIFTAINKNESDPGIDVDLSLNSTEINEWLEIFGSGGDDPDSIM
jgi:predicted RNA-binding protein with PIN domain